jgi:hypothetical protein
VGWRTIPIGLITILIQGCAIALPAGLTQLNWIRNTYDAKQFIYGDKTSMDSTLSHVTGKYCKGSDILERDILETHTLCRNKTPTEIIHEYVEEMP